VADVQWWEYMILGVQKETMGVQEEKASSNPFLSGPQNRAQSEAAKPNTRSSTPLCLALSLHTGLSPKHADLTLTFSQQH